jgi:hypothetical protein
LRKVDAVTKEEETCLGLRGNLKRTAPGKVGGTLDDCTPGRDRAGNNRKINRMY